jgi:hypothetical protein
VRQPVLAVSLSSAVFLYLITSLLPFLHCFLAWSFPKLFLMDPLRDLGRMLLILGAIIAIVGALLYFGARLPFRLGRLPGDIIHRSEHTTFYFPIVSCLFISIVLSAVLWFISNLRR